MPQGRSRPRHSSLFGSGCRKTEGAWPLILFQMCAEASAVKGPGVVVVVLKRALPCCLPSGRCCHLSSSALFNIWTVACLWRHVLPLPCLAASREGGEEAGRTCQLLIECSVARLWGDCKSCCLGTTVFPPPSPAPSLSLSSFASCQPNRFCPRAFCHPLATETMEGVRQCIKTTLDFPWGLENGQRCHPSPCALLEQTAGQSEGATSLLTNTLSKT